MEKTEKELNQVDRRINDEEFRAAKKEFLDAVEPVVREFTDKMKSLAEASQNRLKVHVTFEFNE